MAAHKPYIAMRLAKGIYLRERTTTRGTSYSIRFYHKSREPKEVEINLETDHGPLAAERARDKMQRYHMGVYDPWNDKENTLTIEDAVAKFVRDRKGEMRPSSLRQLGYTLRLFARSVPVTTQLKHVRPDDIQAFVYRRDIKPWTRCNCYEVVRLWLGWCKDRGLIQQNPADGVQRPQKPHEVPRYYTEAQIERLLRVIVEQWYRDMVELAFTSGLRSSELRHLRWRDVRDGFMTVQSYEGYRAKGDSHGVIPMIPRAQRLIDRLESERTNENDEDLVLRKDGQQIKEYLPGEMFRHYREIAKLPDDVPFHGLRHSFAVMCRLAGVDILDLKDLMRHRKIEQTMAYAQFGPDHLQKKVLSAFERKEREQYV